MRLMEHRWQEELSVLGLIFPTHSGTRYFLGNLTWIKSALYTSSEEPPFHQPRGFQELRGTIALLFYSLLGLKKGFFRALLKMADLRAMLGPGLDAIAKSALICRVGWGTSFPFSGGRWWSPGHDPVRTPRGAPNALSSPVSHK